MNKKLFQASRIPPNAFGLSSASGALRYANASYVLPDIFSLSWLCRQKLIQVMDDLVEIFA